MADEIKNQADAAANAPAKVATTIAATTKKVVGETAKTAKRARAATVRRAKRDAKPTAIKKTTRRAKTTRRTATRTATATVRTATRKTAAAAKEGINTMNFTANKMFAGFDAMPTMAPFQSLFSDAGERGQDVARRSQKVAQDVADMTRANVEAIVEAGRVAAEGARSISQDVVARGRQGVEQAADAIRTLAEAKSPTEYLQIQSEIARSSFDRMVAESSRLTESMVKLAGEAIQPLSNRAAANAERMNTLVA